MLLVVVVLVAVLMGTAGVLLLGAPNYAPGARAPPSGGELVIQLPLYVWGILFLLPLVIGYAGVILSRVRQGGGTFGVYAFLGNLLVVLVAVMLIFLLMNAKPGPGLVGYSSSGSGPAANNTTTSTTGNHTNVSAGTSATYSLQPPTYLLWLLAAGLCVVVAVLTVPGVLSRMVDRRSRRGHGGGPAGQRTRVADALGEAAAALERGEEPREAVIRLYLRLLGELSPKTGTLAFETPEEIRALHLTPLGVPPDAAEVLTRLFEEARYSTHPIDTATASRAQGAMRQAVTALLGEVASP